MSTDDHDDGPSVEALAAERRSDPSEKTAALGGLSPLDADIQARPKTARLSRDHYLTRVLGLVMAATDDVHHQSTTALIRGIDRTVGLSPSPGTAYPVMHDLRDMGLIDPVELSRTVANTVADAEAVDAELEKHERELEWFLDAIRLARTELGTAIEESEDDTESDPDADSDTDADA